MLGLKTLHARLWQLLIRPARVPYGEEDLGPRFVCGHEGRFARRLDFEVPNALGETLRLSAYLPCDEAEKPTPTHGAIIYCHTHSGCRVEGLQLLPYALRADCALLLFDFSASGQSTGEFVTLGWREALDLQAVVLFAKTRLRAQSLALWGRSMGAAAVIFFFSPEWRAAAEELLRANGRDPPEWPKAGAVDAAVVDSCFGDLPGAVWNLVQGKAPLVPRPLVDGLFALLDRGVRERIGVSTQRIRPYEHVQHVQVPLFMLVGSRDELVSLETCRAMLDRCRAEIKELRVFDGRHAEDRPAAVLLQAVEFLTDIFAHRREYNRTKSLSCIAKPARRALKATVLRRPDLVPNVGRVGGRKGGQYNPLQVKFAAAKGSAPAHRLPADCESSAQILQASKAGEESPPRPKATPLTRAVTLPSEASQPAVQVSPLARMSSLRSAAERASIFAKRGRTTPSLFEQSPLRPSPPRPPFSAEQLPSPHRSTSLRTSKSLQSLPVERSPGPTPPRSGNIFYQSAVSPEKTPASPGGLDRLAWLDLPDFRASVPEPASFPLQEHSQELQRRFSDDSDYFDQFSADTHFDVLRGGSIALG